MERTNKNNRGKDVDDQLKPLMEPIVVKAFIAGLVLGNLNKGLMLGFVLGAAGGIFISQNSTNAPNISKVWSDAKERWNKSK